METAEPSTEEDDAPSRNGFLRFVRVLRKYLFHTNISPLLRHMFHVHERRLARRRSRVLMIGIGVLILLFWPIDFYIIPDVQTQLQFSIWRALTVAVIGLCVLSVELSEFFRKWINSFYAAVFTLHLPVSGYLMGSVRGLDFPWFYLSFLVPLFSVVFAFTFLRRLVVCCLLTYSFVGGYLLAQTNPFAFRYFGHVLTLSSSAVVLGSVIGHIIQKLDLRNFISNRILRQKQQEVMELATYDQLTGLYNRRKFEEQLTRTVTDAERNNHTMALIMADVDNFKRINDTFGHTAGDRALEYLGDVFDAETRSDDIPGRFGGDEFSIILPEADISAAKRTAERLKSRLEDKEFTTREGTFEIECSIGVALQDGSHSTDAVIRRADKALYRAKTTSGSSIVVNANGSGSG